MLFSLDARALLYSTIYTLNTASLYNALKYSFDADTACHVEYALILSQFSLNRKRNTPNDTRPFSFIMLNKFFVNDFFRRKRANEQMSERARTHTFICRYTHE